RLGAGAEALRRSATTDPPPDHGVPRSGRARWCAVARLLAVQSAAGAGAGELQAALPPERPDDPGSEHADRRAASVHRCTGALPAVLLPGVRRTDRERGVPGTGRTAPRRGVVHRIVATS